VTTKKKHPADITFKDYLIHFGLMIGLSPLWIPMWFVSRISLQLRLFSYLRGNTESACRRCADLWSASKNAYGAEIGPYFDAPLEHSLTENLARYHRVPRHFLIKQLLNPNPYLAAYAFKCLIRCGPITLNDIPGEVLARAERITATRFGCMSESITISTYIRDYFDTTQFAETENQTGTK